MPVVPWVSPDGLVRPRIKWADIACSCCGFIVYDQEALNALDKFIATVGYEVKIESGTKCRDEEGVLTGGQPGPQALGQAFQVRIVSTQPLAILRHAFECGFFGESWHERGLYFLGR